MKQGYHHGALREALLDAAERLLARDGIGGLTLRAVAREAGVSHGSPAHHFRDFAALLSGVAARGFRQLAACMGAEAAASEDGGFVGGLGRGYVVFARDNPALFLLMFRSDQLDRGDSALTEARVAAFTLLAGADADRAALVRAAGRWARVHGLALLMIDGRLDELGARTGLGIDALAAAVLAG